MTDETSNLLSAPTLDEPINDHIDDPIDEEFSSHNNVVDNETGANPLSANEKNVLRIMILAIIMLFIILYKFIYDYISMFFNNFVGDDFEDVFVEADVQSISIWYSPIICISWKSPPLPLALNSTLFSNIPASEIDKLFTSFPFLRKFRFFSIPLLTTLSISIMSLIYHYIPVTDKIFDIVFDRRFILYCLISFVLITDTIFLCFTQQEHNPFLICLIFLWLSFISLASAYGLKYQTPTVDIVSGIVASCFLLIGLIFFQAAANANLFDHTILSNDDDFENYDQDNSYIKEFISSFLGYNSRGNMYLRLKWFFLLVGIFSISLGAYLLKFNILVKYINIKASELLNRGGSRIFIGSLVFGSSLFLIINYHNDANDKKRAPSLLFAGILLFAPGFELFFLSPGTLLKRSIQYIHANYFRIRNLFFSKVISTSIGALCLYYSLCLNRFLYQITISDFSFLTMISEVFMVILSAALFHGFNRYLIKDDLKSRNIEHTERDILLIQQESSNIIRKINSYSFIVIRHFLLIQFIFTRFESKNIESAHSSIYGYILMRFKSILWIWLSSTCSYIIFILIEARKEPDPLVQYNFFEFPLSNIPGVNYFTPSLEMIFISASSTTYFLCCFYFDYQFYKLTVVLNLALAVLFSIPGLLQLQRFKNFIEFIVEEANSLRLFVERYPHIVANFLIFIVFIPSILALFTDSIEYIILGINSIIYGLSQIGEELEWPRVARITSFFIYTEKVLLRLIRAGFSLIFAIAFLRAFLEQRSLSFLLASYASFIATIYLLGDSIDNSKIKNFAKKLFSNIDFKIPYFLKSLIFESGLWEGILKLLKSIKEFFIALFQGIKSGMNDIIIPALRAGHKMLLLFWNHASSTFVLSATLLISLYIIFEYQIDSLIYETSTQLISDFTDMIYSSKDFVVSALSNDSTTKEFVIAGTGKLIFIVRNSGPVEWANIVQQVSSMSDAAKLLHVKSFAWTFYLVPLVISKTSLQNSIKGKIIVVPLTLLIACFGFAPSMFKFVFAASALHFLISITLSIIDHQGRQAAERRYRRWQDQPRNLRTRDRNAAPNQPPPTNIFETLTQTKINDEKEKYETCTICLEANTGIDPPTDTTIKSVKLINCSHAFHHNCISDWLSSVSQSERRCPNCREPVDPPNLFVAALF